MQLVCVLLTIANPSTSRVTAEGFGKPWGERRGVLQFRGNPSHTYYGEGPLPDDPVVLWRFPKKEEMCSISLVGRREALWCGTGWTGQPVVWEHDDGSIEIIFGAFDKRVHFIDGHSGRRVRPDFQVQDIIKGSVTLDPDGYPLIYFGARDNRLRVVSFDRKKPRMLWQLPSKLYKGIYDNDWDANPSVVGGYLLEGGENGYFFGIELNRSYDENNLVTVEPQIRVAFKGWDRALVKKHKKNGRNTSIENSPAVFEDRVYFANGAGRIVGLDLNEVAEGEAAVVFDFWAGDDIDASIVIDEEGMLYVGAEIERSTERSAEVGQLFKLDPSRGDDPLVWKVDVPRKPKNKKGGIWSTPALAFGLVYATTECGALLVVDAETGELVYREQLSEKRVWASPVVVGDDLLIAMCRRGVMRGYSLEDPHKPVQRWHLELGRGGCILSTPVVYKGRIYVGANDGFFYALGDKSQ